MFELLKDIGYQSLLLYEGNGDFMFSSTVDNSIFIEEMHAHFAGRMSARYADICVFHVEDHEFFGTCRESELTFFETYRAGNSDEVLRLHEFDKLTGSGHGRL